MTQTLQRAGRKVLVVLFYANILSIHLHGHHHVELAHLAHSTTRRVLAVVTR